MSTAKTRPENKNALLRMWELPKLLPQREPGKTAGELHKALEARGYSVDKKTIERDLTNLSTILPITCDEETRPYRWYWMPDRSLGLPGVALTEAIALVLVEKSLAGLVHHNLLEPLQLRLEAARRLIAESSPRNRQAAWTEKVVGLPRDLAHQPPAVKPEVFSEVQQALLTDRQLEIEYKSFTSDAPRWRTVNPHALLLKAPVTYLVATEIPSAVDSKPIAKQFALHRMRGARVTAKPVVPGSFKLSRYLKSQAHEVGSNRPIRVRLKVHSKSLQTLLQEVPFARTQRIKVQGGDFIVEAAVRESQALRRWILARGPEVTVLAPASLRKTIQNSLQAAAATYLG